ncbi:MAG: RpiB/LacA/LacB family sugar-phosphate isomerase [Spirochaetaceae bacterium]|nr:RpiB/LacA/LacB family sugar-phosphate isomerase [Spirochaetaceae bacterium]
MKIIMANDHAAVELKNELKVWLLDQGHEVEDLGIGDGEKADYPDKGEQAARLFMKGGYDYGVLCCGTGIGISISANKVKGIRCALPQNIFAAEAAKEHNDCQFIAFGGRIEYPDKPTDMLNAFLSAKFVGDRHQRRVDKIMAIEN